MTDATSAFPRTPVDAERPTLFFVHGLGGSGRAFDGVAAALDGAFRVVGIDLVGFGGTAVDGRGTSVGDMADGVLSQIIRSGAPRWLLVGHSMGGKVVSVVAARALSGAVPVFGLAGVVLLAGSPPTPEPMDDDQRARMIGWVEKGPMSEADARTFVGDNVALDLTDDDETEALDDLVRTDPGAWRAWLERGSREDVSGDVGVLDVPAVIIGGDDDADLGFAAQPGLHGSVYPRARYVELAQTGHLLPYERPREVAAEIVRLWDERIAKAPAVARDWAELIASSRTDRSVRRALAIRALADDPEYVPRVLSAEQLATLRRLADLVVPQDGDRGRIDLAARVDAFLASGGGDGWRSAGLPPDIEAYRAGLDTLARAWAQVDAVDDAHNTHDVHDAAARDVIERVMSGTIRVSGPLSPEALTAWLEDARVDLVQQWMAHPATMARIGYDGFATGGQPQHARGFLTLLPRRRDPWEPAELGSEGATA